MGHYEREIVDYNPVTDRNYYGDKKYVEDENDRRASLEKYGREKEASTIKAYIDSIKSSSDYEWIEKARDAIENARHLDYSEKSFWRDQLNKRIYSYERVEYNKREADYQKSKKARENRERDQEERDKAFAAAKKRYKSLSLFGKIKHFKHRPSTIHTYGSNAKSSEEINQLYRRR